MKASAKAHPIQGLIKYHGLKEETLRLPYHDNISVCTAPLETHTTVAFGDDTGDSLTINGQDASGRELVRARAVVDEVRRRAGLSAAFKAVSKNNFPSNIGLGASASGFAALATAACEAAGLDLPPEKVSAIARRGSGSASRAVTGGFSKWIAGDSDETSYAVQLVGDDLEMGIVVALVEARKSTEDAHREAPSSPFFQARLAEMPRMVAEMELALLERDVGKVMVLAERDTLLLHSISMTGDQEMLLWRPKTLEVILEVKKMREDGVPAFFSIDTGATVYVNTFPDRVGEVEDRLSELGLETMRCHVGGPAGVVEEHLF